MGCKIEADKLLSKRPNTDNPTVNNLDLPCFAMHFRKSVESRHYSDENNYVCLNDRIKNGSKHVTKRFGQNITNYYSSSSPNQLNK